jgi:proteic killer suppression protein
MIKGFQHKGLKRLFESDDHRGVPTELARKLKRQLDFLNAAAVVTDMDLPGYALHELKGERKGTWAIKVTGNWRITFTFEDGDADDVDFEDYH